MASTSNDGYEILLRRLISARTRAGMQQAVLAKRLDKPQSFVSKYERGERRLDVVEFITICRILDADPHNIVGEIGAHLESKQIVTREQSA